MNKTAFNTATGLMWVALPITAFRYWSVWDRLPARMASHFDAAGQANGWMTREVSLEFALGLTVFLLAIFTGISLAARLRNVTDAVSWSLLGLFYLVLGFVYHINSSVVDYNLTATPVAVGPILLVVPLAVLVFIAIYLGRQRGVALAGGSPIAVEAHNSRMWGAVFLILLVPELRLFRATPLLPVKTASVVIAILLASCAAFAWRGFQYSFTSAGLEIRTLGFRLRSIPREQIQSYQVENWNPLRGYGIRGIGNRRAYVWGAKVVHIKTAQGEVFLGHSEPERLVRDLDAMKQLGR